MSLFLLLILRWWILRLRIDRHPVRRPAPILQERQGRNQTDEARHRAENLGMEGTAESTTADNVVRTGAAGGMSVLDERKSSQRPKHYSRMSRMFPFWSHKRVRFSPNVRMYFQTIWSERDYRRPRIGPWIHLAADRYRFQRRINEFDSDISSDIFLAMV